MNENTADPDVIGDSLDWFIGSWSDEHAAEFEEVLADFDVIDGELWR